MISKEALKIEEGLLVVSKFLDGVLLQEHSMYIF